MFSNRGHIVRRSSEGSPEHRQGRRVITQRDEGHEQNNRKAAKADNKRNMMGHMQNHGGENTRSLHLMCLQSCNFSFVLRSCNVAVLLVSAIETVYRQLVDQVTTPSRRAR